MLCREGKSLLHFLLKKVVDANNFYDNDYLPTSG